MTRSTIKITVLEYGIETIVTSIREYRNLMELLKDKMYLDGFGECGGMGRCASCMVKINGLKGVSMVQERNEPVTLSRYDIVEENIRLACQIAINSDLDGCEIEILENN